MVKPPAKKLREAIDESDETPVATLVIHGAGKITFKQRERLSDWLIEQIHGLLVDGGEYPKRYRARYFG